MKYVLNGDLDMVPGVANVQLAIFKHTNPRALELSSERFTSDYVALNAVKSRIT